MNTAESSQSTDPRIATYLEALGRALYGLPEPSRSEVYDEIRQHIDDQLAERGDDANAVPEILDRLGDPNDIAREAGAGYVAPDGYPGAYPGYSMPPRRSRLHEIFAVILLAIGGFVFVIGWVVGAVLLWTSDRFTRADKIIGTVLVPGGFATGFLALVIGVGAPVSAQTCYSTSSPAVNGGTVQLTNHCTGGVSTTTSIIAIVVTVIMLFGPLYTVIRLSRRVARM
jgi:uncharacterized membrane protein